MRSILITIALLSISLLSVMVLFNGTAPIEDTHYQVNTVLRCQNNPFQSEVLFITEMDHPLEFQCITDVTPAIPDGYIPAPVNLQWKATSGDLQTKDNITSWNHFSEGLQEIHVSGTLNYLAPQPSGFFSRKKPDIEIVVDVSMKCMAPRIVETLPDGKINGFLIGTYPNPKAPSSAKKSSTKTYLKIHADTYQQPRLFYPVTKETYRLRIFKDYTLGDFDLDPRFLPLTYPRYVAINPLILKKIDRLETVVRNAGIQLSKFKIFYGFRSPGYNLGERGSDGEKTLKSGFSTHMYGLAVDFLIDEDDDLVMDDLDGDGTITVEDAKVLYRYVNQLDKILIDEGSDLVGGAGWYIHHDFWERGAYVQSPYVHMDTRGFSYGENLVRWVGKDTIGIAKQKDPYKLRKPIPPWPW